MTIQNLRNESAGVPLLQATVLGEIVGSHAAHLVIDELGLAMATHTGLKRERNEDRVAVARITAPNAETYTIAVVCDGVGGSESGDQAAALTIASIITHLAVIDRLQPLEEVVVDLVRQADELVRKELQGRGMTTLVMLVATASGQVVCANVGDSRAYSWDQSSKKLEQVTVDDTIENALKHLPGNPDALIKARGLQGRLSQAIGEGGRTVDELRIQMYGKECFSLGFMVGSDGLWRAAKDFETAAAHAITPNDAVRRAITLANWVGGVDNASVIAVRDLEQLCGDSQARPSVGRKPMEIVLWVPSAKIKILTSNWIGESKPTQVSNRPEKQKRSTKKKEPPKAANELQLELESVTSTKARPKIEVTINEEPKQIK